MTLPPVSKRILLSGTAIALALAMPVSAAADDFVVDTPATTTNDGNVIDGDDSLNITQTGSIDVTANPGDDGVYATGINNVITNNGQIAADGPSGLGISAENRNMISNTGSITTGGLSGYGIFALSYNDATNSGMITTSGDGAHGIRFNEFSTIDNSGTISTTGLGAFAISAGDFNSVTNTGTLTTTGSGSASAISVGDLNLVVNSGTILTMGEGSDGVTAGGINRIENSGVITVHGPNARGINVTNYNEIENTGTITTTGGGGGVDASAIHAESNNIISNSGELATTGVGAGGIFVSSYNTITNSGSITTSNTDGVGVYALGNNMISNTGSITTGGLSGYGIFAMSYNDATNSGMITTSGDGAHGIRFNQFSTIDNSGTISTTGVGAFAISADDFNSVTNTGTLTTTGSGSASAISVGDLNLVVNSGTILTMGEGSDGVTAGGINRIENSGVITVQGPNARGINVTNYNEIENTGAITTTGGGGGVDASAIHAESNNIISNSGRLRTSGAGSIGIFADTDNTISNSGLVVSAQSDAFHLGADNTLNLMAPSFLGGVIDLGTNTTVNITTGPSHSILWDFSTGTMTGNMPNIGGPVPFFYNPATQQVATFDPTGLSAAPDMLADVSGNLSGLVQSRLHGAGIAPAQTASGVSGYLPASDASRIDQAFDSASSSYAPASGVWISGFGSSASYQGNSGTLDSNFTHTGFALGLDRVVSPDLVIGVLGGYGEGSFDAGSRFANSYDNTAEGWFAALYGRKSHGQFFFDFTLSGGVFDHSDSRFVNDNLAPLGVSQASASYNSWWLSPEAAIGMNIAGANGWMWAPSARLRYAIQSIDGYSETGPSAANATVGSRDIGVVEGRVELAASKPFEFGILTARLGLLARAYTGDDGVGVTMIGQTSTVPFFEEDRIAGYAGAQTRIGLSESTSLDLDGEVIFGDGVTGLRGAAKFVAIF